MNIDGVVAVARQEFTLRIRKGRWRWLLATWAVVLFGFTSLVRLALNAAGEEVEPYRGAIMFGALMLFVLSLALLVVPAIAAQSINGDRERGVLATLQVTRLSPLEIALGKFAAAWGTALVFLASTAPLVLWAYVNDGVSVKSVLVVTVVMAVLLGAVCAVSLGLSAVLARSSTSSVLAYLSVFALGAGTLIVFGLSMVVVKDTIRDPGGQYEYSQPRPDRVWFLLAPNPFVVLADSAPYRPVRYREIQTPEGLIRIEDSDSTFDPLGVISRAVRDVRVPPTPPCFDFREDAGCYVDEEEEARKRGRPGPVWPTGLAVHLALAVGGIAVTVRQLRTPAGALARGQRVA